MNKMLDTYRTLINEMITEYKKLGEDAPDKIPDIDVEGYYRGVSIRREDDILKISAYDNEEVRDFNYTYRKEKNEGFIIMYVNGYLVSHVNVYTGWTRTNRENGKEYGAGKNDNYLLISHVGEEYDIDNPPSKIDSVVNKISIKKMGAVIKESNSLIHGYYRKVDLKIDNLCKKLK